jgi:glutaredoxin
MKTLGAIGIIVAILVGIIYATQFLSSKESEYGNLDGFAQCLASKNFTMYGAEWCPHCKREKALFGTSWKYVPYVECPENTKLCLDKGVTGYPTWISADGSKYEGEQGLERIASESSCTLPERK